MTLPLGRLAEFETSVRAVVAEVAPAAAVVLWGHVGDGNLHVNVVGPAPDDETVDDAVLRWSPAWAAASAPSTASAGPRSAGSA